MDTDERRCECCGMPLGKCRCWETPGTGKVTHLDDLSSTEEDVSNSPRSTLGELAATAICGNDITSSCLYVAAIAGLHAGPLAPVALLLVAGVLYLFRWVYAEVGGALPLNGGAYNVLLNTTTKGWAAVAAALTVLSYVATAVLSAGEAAHYAARVWPGAPVAVLTVTILAIFAGLSLLGISESASAAVLVFGFHLATMACLIMVGLIAVVTSPEQLITNLTTPAAEWCSATSFGMAGALFFGFSAAMLGVSGFESSANFIEEQRPGVFPRTLRNMWLAVAILNPTISVLSLGLLRLEEFTVHREALLAEMARRAATAVTGSASLGEVLAGWVCVDAVLVLAGAVLTSYVGVIGLIRRMSLDLCLPEVLLRRNVTRGTHHWIILVYLGLCLSVLAITRGELHALAGVYTVSFLSVMALFAAGNLLLARRRPGLPRPVRAGTAVTVAALGAVLLGLVGNLILEPSAARVFAAYFAGALVLLGACFWRVPLLVRFLRGLGSLGEAIPGAGWLSEAAAAEVNRIGCRQAVFFASSFQPDRLEKAARYLLENEDIRRLLIVHCQPGPAPPIADLVADGAAEENSGGPAAVAALDHAFVDLRVDLMIIQGDFGPAMTAALSRRIGVPPNYMFLGSPDQHFPHDLPAFGGVRLIC